MLAAHAVDSLGHEADSAPATVTRDTLPPEVTIIEPVADAQLDSQTVTVRGTVADPHLDRVTVGAVEAVVEGDEGSAPRAWTATGVGLPEGDAEIIAHAVDTLGHAS